MNEEKRSQDADTGYDPVYPGVKPMPSIVKERSSRDLERCVKTDLRNQSDPQLLERLLSKLNAGSE